MLQHPSRTSRAGWLEARRLLAAFLAGESPAEVRRQNRARLDSGRRPWRMTRGEAVVVLTVEPPPGLTWSRTIADVRLADTAVYCADVVAWAHAVLSDTEGWQPRPQQ
jgi:hypothetical protein